MKVEVRCDEEGFKGSSFPRIVIGIVNNSGRPKYCVHYDHLILDEVSCSSVL